VYIYEGLAIVDFTNPSACKWYNAKLTALLDLGVDCFKVKKVYGSKDMSDPSFPVLRLTLVRLAPAFAFGADD
jgi:alpha-glucosidase (family GH31 glycosyl hydrolase)